MTRSPLTLAEAEAQAAAFIEARRLLHGDLRMEAPDGDNPPADDDSGDPAGDDDTPTETAEEKAARLEAELAETKRHARKHEDRAKANKAKADEFDRLKASTATDAERLTAAEERAVKAERELTRFRVAADTGLPVDLADLLTGDDEDAMTAQAKKILALKGDPPKPKPKPDPAQGGSGGKSKTSEADVGRAEAQRRIAARQKKS